MIIKPGADRADSTRSDWFSVGSALCALPHDFDFASPKPVGSHSGPIQYVESAATEFADFGFHSGRVGSGQVGSYCARLKTPHILISHENN